MATDPGVESLSHTRSQLDHAVLGLSSGERCLDHAPDCPGLNLFQGRTPASPFSRHRPQGPSYTLHQFCGGNVGLLQADLE